MAQKLEIDCTTGRSKVVPLTPAEQADYDARLAGAPALAAAQVTTIANQATLQQRALAALTTNDAFLALTLAQQATQGPAQIVQMTKECSTLIRLLLGQFNTTAGT